MSLVKWVEQKSLITIMQPDHYALNCQGLVEVIPLAALTEVVEGLKLIRDIARHDHTGPLNPFGWLVRIDEEAEHLLAQLEAHRKEGA